MAEAPRTGGCACGALRLEIAADPIIVRMCWCRLCQRLGAGSATVNAMFPRAAVATTGEVAWYECEADSGSPMRRGFCPRCGTQVFTYTEARPTVMGIRVGALDDPDSTPPQAVIWTSEAPPWAVIDPALPRFEGQPPAPPAP